jgi:transcriptional regulator with XRE-family HTH domain
MASPHLPNYLRAHRKRLGLSQDEIAYLLGAASGAKVSRYERFVRGASFETALACEAVFKRPASELFAGLYKKIEREVAARAAALAQRIDERRPNRRTARKRQTLAAMAILQTKKPLKQS